MVAAKSLKEKLLKGKKVAGDCQFEKITIEPSENKDFTGDASAIPGLNTRNIYKHIKMSSKLVSVCFVLIKATNNRDATEIPFVVYAYKSSP